MVYRFIFVLFIAIKANGQINPGSPQFTALGNSGASLQDVASLGSNQAGVAKLKTPVLALVHVEHFLGSDIKSQAGMVVVPGRLGVVGLYIGKYGLQNSYSELKAGITYARMFGPKLAMAMTTNYHQLKISKYGANNTFSAEFGVQYFFTEDWIVGIHVSNPGNFSFDNESYAKIPVKVQLGTSYRFSEQVLICVDGKYILDSGFDGSMGLEYALVRLLHLRGGISVNHFQQYVGFGLSYQRLSFDAAASIHPRLGISPQIGLCYAF